MRVPNRLSINSSRFFGMRETEDAGSSEQELDDDSGDVGERAYLESDQRV